jgi:hypothetical protein
MPLGLGEAERIALIYSRISRETMRLDPQRLGLAH